KTPAISNGSDTTSQATTSSAGATVILASTRAAVPADRRAGISACSSSKVSIKSRSVPSGLQIAGAPQLRSARLRVLSMREPLIVPELLKTADPVRPLVTFYDDATGERIELSATTFGNWVAKTANLLVDELDAEPGDRIALDLPPHWQTAVWLFAAWSAGLHVVPRGSGEEILAVAEARLPVHST